VVVTTTASFAVSLLRAKLQVSNWCILLFL